jgi:hypothetical protein
MKSKFEALKEFQSWPAAYRDFCLDYLDSLEPDAKSDTLESQVAEACKVINLRNEVSVCPHAEDSEPYEVEGSRGAQRKWDAKEKAKIAELVSRSYLSVEEAYAEFHILFPWRSFDAFSARYKGAVRYAKSKKDKGTPPSTEQGNDSGELGDFN